ncbi:MAG: fasciclin domain-containing protein [Erythrobacter sp.]|nr:fasciclin domain-containing protein [Erythrobacter sp.]
MMTRTMRAFALVALPASLALAACSTEPTESPATEETDSDTVAQAIAATSGLSTLSRAVTDAQLAEVLDGSASYTIFAPTDEAFTALGEDGQRLLEVEQRPLLVGLLREHIVPGHITPDAIGQAIDAQGGPVTMTTMGGGTLTFSREGEIVTVSRNDGASAGFANEIVEAGNGVVVPIDAALMPQTGAAGGSGANTSETAAAQ